MELIDVPGAVLVENVAPVSRLTSMSMGLSSQGRDHDDQ